MTNAAPTKGISHVEGVFHYLANTQERPAYHVNPDRNNPPKRPAQNEYTIPVYNGRDVQDQLSLDQQGLVLTRRATQMKSNRSTIQRPPSWSKT
jgi:hypothetical protein